MINTLLKVKQEMSPCFKITVKKWLFLLKNYIHSLFLLITFALVNVKPRLGVCVPRYRVGGQKIISLIDTYYHHYSTVCDTGIPSLLYRQR